MFDTFAIMLTNTIYFRGNRATGICGIVMLNTVFLTYILFVRLRSPVDWFTYICSLTELAERVLYSGQVSGIDITRSAIRPRRWSGDRSLVSQQHIRSPSSLPYILNTDRTRSRDSEQVTPSEQCFQTQCRIVHQITLQNPSR